MSSLINIEKIFNVDLPDLNVKLTFQLEDNEITVKYTTISNNVVLSLGAILLKEVNDYNKIAWYECGETEMSTRASTDILNATTDVLNAIVAEFGNVINIF